MAKILSISNDVKINKDNLDIDVIVETKTYSTVAITIKSASGAYYSAGYNISKTGYRIIGFTLESWNGASSIFVPYTENGNLAFMSNVSQTVSMIKVNIVYLNE